MAKAPLPTRPVWPWDQVQLELHEVSVIKAIPQAAFDVLDKICGVGRNPFTAGGAEGQRATDFGSGKLWVGHTLRDIRAMKMPTPVRGAPPADLPNSPTPATPARSET